MSVLGPVRAARLAYRNRREPNLYPADARWALPDAPYSLGMRALAAFHLAGGGYGQAQEVIQARTGVTLGRAQLAGLARDLAAWTGDFYEQRAAGADAGLPDSDVLMMQADGKGIALRPEHRGSPGKGTDAAHPGIKKMAEIVAGVADFTPAVREPEEHRRTRRPAAGRTPDRKHAMGGYRRPGRPGDHPRHDQRRVRRGRRAATRTAPASACSWWAGTGRRSRAIRAPAAGERGLKVPVLIDFIHVSGYLGKAAAALHPGDPAAAARWADGQKLRVLHGRAQAVAATLKSVAARARANPRTRHLDLTDMDGPSPT